MINKTNKQKISTLYLFMNSKYHLSKICKMVYITPRVVYLLSKTLRKLIKKV